MFVDSDQVMVNLKDNKMCSERDPTLCSYNKLIRLRMSNPPTAAVVNGSDERITLELTLEALKKFPFEDGKDYKVLVISPVKKKHVVKVSVQLDDSNGYHLEETKSSRNIWNFDLKTRRERTFFKRSSLGSIMISDQCKTQRLAGKRSREDDTENNVSKRAHGCIEAEEKKKRFGC